MKKSMIVVISVMFIALFSIVASAKYVWNNDGGFHFECLHKGDWLKVWECKSDTCIVCQKNGYNNYPFSDCSDQSPICSRGGNNNNNNSFDLKAPVITLTSPTNGAYFGSRSVPFTITTDEKANIYYINNADTRRGWILICSNTQSCSKSISLTDGLQNMTIMAQDSSQNQAKKVVVFTIDSQKPIIKSFLPKAGSFTKGLFTVDYDEANLKKVTLFWKPSGSSTYNQVSKTTCSKGLKQECNITVATLPQGDITYYFKIEDAATPVNSAETTVHVDTVPPVLTKLDPHSTPYADKAVPFNLLVSEPVTLEYIDYKDARPSYKQLCKGCTTLQKTVSFNDGNHSVEIRAKDLAGNTDSELVSFFVDSIDPKIKDMVPKDKTYANGYFKAVVEEANLKSVILHYKENTKQFKTLTDTGAQCNLTKTKNTYNCVFNVLLTVQGPLAYYFELIDPATIVQTKQFNVTVDTIAPILKVTSPTALQAKRSTLFNMTTNEPVTLSYIDLSLTNAKPSTLCSKCTKYLTTKTLAIGSHDIVFTATDYAGNPTTVERKFTIVS